MGLLQAIIEAIQGEDDRLAGQTVTTLQAVLSDTETTTMTVKSTLRFGEYTDGASDARLLVNGEVITATGRTTATGNMTFTGLTRGVDSTIVKTHPVGTLVYDITRNRSAIDLVRRGLLVNFAVGEDLDVVGRNLGLEKCAGIDEDQWRRIIKALAYLPKGTVHAIDTALEAFFNNTTDYTLREKLISDPNKVLVEVEQSLASGAANVRGRWILSQTEFVTTATIGFVTISNTPVASVIGVYLAEDTRASRGYRGGTNYFTGGSVGGSVLTLGTSLPFAPIDVVVDYKTYGSDSTIAYHFLADNEQSLPGAIKPDGGSPAVTPAATVDADDRWAYISDPLDAIRCLLDQVRPVGTGIELSLKI